MNFITQLKDYIMMSFIKNNSILTIFVVFFVIWEVVLNEWLSKKQYWCALILVFFTAYLNRKLLSKQLSRKQIFGVTAVFILISCYLFTPEKPLQTPTEILFNFGLFLAANAAVNIDKLNQNYDKHDSKPESEE